MAIADGEQLRQLPEKPGFNARNQAHALFYYSEFRASHMLFVTSHLKHIHMTADTIRTTLTSTHTPSVVGASTDAPAWRPWVRFRLNPDHLLQKCDGHSSTIAETVLFVNRFIYVLVWTEWKGLEMNKVEDRPTSSGSLTIHGACSRQVLSLVSAGVFKSLSPGHVVGPTLRMPI